MERREARGGTLILGGGFAGSYVARLLKRSGATIVSHENFMLYTPLLPEAASGTLEPRHVVVPIREMCPHAELVLGSIMGHDRGGKSVTVESLAGPIEIGYERLVISLGATTRALPVPGLAEHGSGSRTSLTRSRSATASCCSSSAPRSIRTTRPSSASCSWVRDTREWKHWPS